MDFVADVYQLTQDFMNDYPEASYPELMHKLGRTDGPESLLSPKTNKRYSKELKLQAVHAYLSGEGSLDEICARFGIRQHPQLSSWIKAYNEGKELKELTGGSIPFILNLLMS